MIILLCGLSGAGKTTLANNVKSRLVKTGNKVELIDGDEYRQTLCKDLGFSKEDRCENLRRLGFVANRLSRFGIISIISAICPYEEIRNEIKTKYNNVSIVHIDCSIERLIERDTKGLYHLALLPEDHPQKINNLTGINDAFEIPQNHELYINTGIEALEESSNKLFYFIKTMLSEKTSVAAYKNYIRA
ncbi:MAG TPA: adenylyl-sulfate kinase [Flavisolibacter sp.]|nr:adenylyl-sulfate kinase [Flavisolibacter sp.]